MLWNQSYDILKKKGKNVYFAICAFFILNLFFFDENQASKIKVMFEGVTGSFIMRQTSIT